MSASWFLAFPTLNVALMRARTQRHAHAHTRAQTRTHALTHAVSWSPGAMLISHSSRHDQFLNFVSLISVSFLFSCWLVTCWVVLFFAEHHLMCGVCGGALCPLSLFAWCCVHPSCLWVVMLALSPCGWCSFPPLGGAAIGRERKAPLPETRREVSISTRMEEGGRNVPPPTQTQTQTQLLSLSALDDLTDKECPSESLGNVTPLGSREDSLSSSVSSPQHFPNIPWSLQVFRNMVLRCGDRVSAFSSPSSTSPNLARKRPMPHECATDGSLETTFRRVSLHLRAISMLYVSPPQKRPGFATLPLSI